MRHLLLLAMSLSSCCCWDCGDRKPAVLLPPGVLAGTAKLREGPRVATFDLELCNKNDDTCVVQHVTDGGFWFSGLDTSAHWRIVASTADHHHGRETELEIKTLDMGVSPYELELMGGTWVHGRVLADSKPVAGARVEAETLELGRCRDCVVEPLKHETVTDDAGRYELDGLGGRGYVVRASAEGLLSNEQPVAGALEVVERVINLPLSRARADGGEPLLFISTDLRGVVVPEEDARVLSVDGVEVQSLGKFVANDLLVANPNATLVLELADGGVTKRSASSR